MTTKNNCCIRGALAAALFVGVLTAAAAVSAINAKQIPGVVCRSLVQSTQDDLEYNGDSGGYVTKSGAVTTVDCPLLTDFPNQSSDGLSTLYAYVKPGTSGNVSCTATCSNGTGTRNDYATEVSSGTSAQTLTWTGSDLADGCQVDDYWRVYCSIGNGAKIFGIKWTEYTP
jgi:hypothetical protein